MLLVFGLLLLLMLPLAVVRDRVAKRALAIRDQGGTGWKRSYAIGNFSFFGYGFVVSILFLIYLVPMLLHA